MTLRRLFHTPRVARAAVIAAALLTAAAASMPAASADATPTGKATPRVVSPAISLEYNAAVAGTPPAGIPCIAVSGATACFQSNGDRWWVKDTVADGLSAISAWANYHGASLYRYGICANRLGNGHWGYCSKNYAEGTEIDWQSCKYDVPSETYHGCSNLVGVTTAAFPVRVLGHAGMPAA
jgi:hypothetical protein